MKYILSLAFIFLNLIATSQDYIRQNGKPDIKCKVVEIGDVNIKYKKFENITGPDYSIKRELVLDIIFENGTMEVFGKEVPQKAVGAVNLEAELSAIPRFTKAQWEQCALNTKVLKEDEKADIEHWWIKNWVENKEYAYNKFPNFQMKDRNGQNVIIPEYITKMKKFPNKPTLVIAYALDWCDPCFPIIDSLLDAGIQEEYNVVLVSLNDDSDGVDLKSRMQWIRENKPKYLNTTLLFNRNSEMDLMAKGAPRFYFLDQKDNIHIREGGLYKTQYIINFSQSLVENNSFQKTGESQVVLTTNMEDETNYTLVRKILGNKYVLITKAFLPTNGSKGESYKYLYEVDNDGFLVPPYKK